MGLWTAGESVAGYYGNVRSQVAIIAAAHVCTSSCKQAQNEALLYK